VMRGWSVASNADKLVKGAKVLPPLVLTL